ncbi:MAG TPA: BamA/TamA family outer membrane protein [Bacteroidales bacterium]
MMTARYCFKYINLSSSFDYLKVPVFYLTICFCLIFQTPANCQKPSLNEIPVRKWDVSVLPSFLYNTDKGLQYGALANIVCFDDSLQHQKYLFNLYLQSSHSTKGNFVNYFLFDSKQFLPHGFRIIADLTYLINNFQQFYGFNGFDALYNRNYLDRTNKEFISRPYYNIRKISKTISIDLQGRLPLSHFRWDLGLGYFNISIPSFKGKIQRVPTLFDKYVSDGVIPAAQKNGGVTTYLKYGVIYDTRDDEVIPKKGVWIEGILIQAPQFLKNKSSYYQIAFIHRQYISLTSKLLFTYRLAYQTKISGDMPFYMMPYLQSTYRVQGALGGVKTLRGILNERLQGNGFVLGNGEFRYFAFTTHKLGHEIAVAFNLFTDAGMITNKYKISSDLNNQDFNYTADNEKMHFSIGNGVRFIMNKNFIVSIDYGRALNKNDGRDGFYLDLDYLY